jgi:hypothetical protein
MLEIRFSPRTPSSALILFLIAKISRMWFLNPLFICVLSETRDSLFGIFFGTQLNSDAFLSVYVDVRVLSNLQTNYVCL